MYAHPDRLHRCQHPRQLRRNPLRQRRRRLGADPYQLDVRNRAQRAQQPPQLGIRQHQRIPPRNQHIAHLRMPPQPLERRTILPPHRWPAAAPRRFRGARAGAIAAKHGAIPRCQQKRLVRIRPDQPRRHRMRLLAQRIRQLPGGHPGLAPIRQQRPPQGPVRRLLRQQRQHVGRHRQRHAPGFRRGQRAPLALGQRQHPRDLRRRARPASQLPAPVRPVRGRRPGIHPPTKVPLPPFIHDRFNIHKTRYCQKMPLR